METGGQSPLDPPEGWQGTLRRADTVGRGIRTGTDLYGLVRTRGTGLCGGYALRKFQSAGHRSRAEHPCAFSSTRGEALRCRAKRRQEAREGASPTADHMAAAPCRHRALSRPTAAGDGASASNLKKPHCVPQAFLQHTGRKGGTRGKSEVSPRVPCAVRSSKNIAHSLWLAERIAQCTGWGQCRNRPYRPYRPYRTYGTWLCVCNVPRSFQSTWLCVLLAGGALCAMHRVGAKNVGLVGQVGLVGRLAHGAECAAFPGVSKTHGLPRRSAA